VWDRFMRSNYVPGLTRDTVLGLISGHLPSLALLGILAIEILAVLLLVRVLSMAWSGVRLHDFRLSRVGDDLRTEYGLLTRVTATVPLRRVQTLTIRQAPLQRLLDRMSIRVDTAGGQAKPQDGAPKQPREQLAPIIRSADVPALVREVLPGLELSAIDWQPLHPRAFWRALKPPLLFVLVIAAGLTAWLGWPVLVLLPFALAWTAFATSKDVQHTQWAASEDTVAFRSGWLWRQVVVVPVAKIQAVGRGSPRSIDARRWPASGSIPREAHHRRPIGSAFRISHGRRPGFCTTGSPRKPRRLRLSGSPPQLPIPNAQLPITPNSQQPTTPKAPNTQGPISPNSQRPRTPNDDRRSRYGTWDAVEYGSTGLESEETVRISLRELKETRVRLRMLRRCGLLTADHDPVIKESDELVRIVATIIRKSEGTK
jgi:membrane protein YdbS with pleckstrin-like domain